MLAESQTKPGDELESNRENPDEAKQLEIIANLPERDAWGGKLEFILTCVGFAVGLGNVWRFPYLCYKHGGGAFLIPYTIMLVVVGLPLFFMEFAFGQFASLGPISVWSISPLFKGVGYAMTIMSWYVGLYYNVVIAQCVHFFFSSMQGVLPWSTCTNDWNDENTCLTTEMAKMKLDNKTIYLTNNISASEQYYDRKVLQITSGLHDMGGLNWELTLCLLFCWTVVCLVLLKGVQSLGKMSYFTATFPYLILTILLVRGVTLPGSGNGVLFYLTPKFARLGNAEAWTDAATQIFFSLSVCNGGLITMSSYNKFKNNCCRDAVLVAVINCATSVYAGFVIFSNLGYMAYLKGTTVDGVAKGGPGLAFVVYPEALANMSVAPLWSILFFIMMMTLGFGSQFSIVETVMSAIQDEFRTTSLFSTRMRKVIFRIIMCIFGFLLGLPMVSRGGMYLLNLVDNTVSGYPLLIIAFMEVIVVMHFYGIRQFERDIEMMTGTRPNIYWRANWFVLTPCVIFALVIFYLAGASTFTYGSYTYPPWAMTLSTLIALTPLLVIVFVFAYRYCEAGGWILLKEYIKPKPKWGPAEAENRENFLTGIRSTVSLATGRSEISLESINGIAMTDATPGEKFFQSKQRVVEKLSKAASRGNGLNSMGSKASLAPIPEASSSSREPRESAAAVAYSATPEKFTVD